MNYKIIIGVLLASIIVSCKPSGHEHEESENAETHEEHEEVKFQYTAYSNHFELFAEADAFVVGKKANVLSHLSILPDFKAVENGKTTITLTVNGEETKQTLEKPTRKGIYSFDIQPKTTGTGNLTFEISTDEGKYAVIVPEVTVFANEEEAHEAFEKDVVSKTNTTVFTKEQSWKINFKTEQVKQEPFGQIIKTVAKIQPKVTDENVLVAKTRGMVLFSNKNLLEGSMVTRGQTLFNISSGGIANDDLSVKMAEAENNYRMAETNFLRKKELAKDKIISENELLEAKNSYENAKAVYANLSGNFSESGQQLTSPTNGFVKQIFVANGQFVETGQPLITISQNRTLILNAMVPQIYSGMLSTIHSANIKTIDNKHSYTLEELNGKVVSYGQSVSDDNYLISVNLQIDHTAGFVQGSLVEVYLKTLTNTEAITVPNTALLEEQGNYFVFVQITPELFEKRLTITGATDGIRTEILSGLLPQERIVSEGAMLIELSKASGTLDPHSGHVH